MSMVTCEGCDRPIDSDDDAECFVEIGNMRRLHQTITLCEPCRDRRQDQEDTAINAEPPTNHHHQPE